MLGYLGQAAYGLWVIFGSIVGYFSFFSLGMNTAVTKYTAEYTALNRREDLNKLVSTTIVTFGFIGILIALICLGLIPFIPRLFSIPEALSFSGKITFVIMSFNTILMLLAGIYGNVIYGHQRVDIWKVCMMIQLITSMLFTLLFLYFGLGLIGVAVASTLSTLILIALYLFFLHSDDYKTVISYRLANVNTLKEIMPYSIRSFVLGITSQILYFTDNIVIGLFLGAELVTSYSIAYKLCFLVTYVFSAISTTLFPKFSNLYALGKIDELKELFLKITKISVAIMTPLAIFLLFYGNSFINLWVGKENFIGMQVLALLIVMDFFHAFGTPSGLLLQGIGKNKMFMYSEIINAVLNLGLSVFLVKEIGVVGVALAKLIAHLFTSYWCVPLQVLKYTKLSVLHYLKSGILPPLLIGLLTGWIIWMFQDKLLPANNFVYLGLNGIIIVIIYAFIYVTIASNKEERRVFLHLLPISFQSNIKA